MDGTALAMSPQDHAHYNKVTFAEVPIGATFDVVGPKSVNWGDPFFIKTSETTCRPDKDGGGDQSYGTSGWCWLVEDPLRRAVRLAREEAGVTL